MQRVVKDEKLAEKKQIEAKRGRNQKLAAI